MEATKRPREGTELMETTTHSNPKRRILTKHKEEPKMPNGEPYDPPLTNIERCLIGKFLWKFPFEDRGDVAEWEYSHYYDPSRRLLNPRVNTHHLVKRFLQQVRESRGYDVDCSPPPRFRSPFHPMNLEMEKDKSCYDDIVEMTNIAIAGINAELGGTTYELVKVEKAVDTIYRLTLLTFTAKEVGADAAVKTFRAIVKQLCQPSPWAELAEWRFKPSSDNEAA